MEKIQFFQFFLFKTKFFFVKAKFYMKISSFEVHYVDVAEMIGEWEGGNNGKFC